MGSIKDPEDGHAAAKVRTHLIRALWAVRVRLPAHESENFILDLLCRCVGVWYICGILWMSGLCLVTVRCFYSCRADAASIASSQ